VVKLLTQRCQIPELENFFLKARTEEWNYERQRVCKHHHIFLLPKIYCYYCCCYHYRYYHYHHHYYYYYYYYHYSV